MRILRVGLLGTCAMLLGSVTLPAQMATEQVGDFYLGLAEDELAGTSTVVAAMVESPTGGSLMIACDREDILVAFSHGESLPWLNYPVRYRVDDEPVRGLGTWPNNARRAVTATIGIDRRILPPFQQFYEELLRGNVLKIQVVHSSLTYTHTFSLRGSSQAFGRLACAPSASAS